MKTKEEIDELYHKLWDDFSNKYDDNLHYYSFVEGYTQCQEDMADKKYTEEDIKKAIDETIKCCNIAQKESYGDLEIDADKIINSLNKQD